LQQRHEMPDREILALDRECDRNSLSGSHGLYGCRNDGVDLRACRTGRRGVLPLCCRLRRARHQRLRGRELSLALCDLCLDVRRLRPFGREKTEPPDEEDDECRDDGQEQSKLCIKLLDHLRSSLERLAATLSC